MENLFYNVIIIDCVSLIFFIFTWWELYSLKNKFNKFAKKGQAEGKK